MPDACVNILFNQVDTDIAGVTALRTTFEVLNLGTSFHYVGIQLLPGVWQGNRQEIADSFVGTPYQGQLPLAKTNAELAMVDFIAKQPIMSTLMQWFMDADQSHFIHSFRKITGYTPAKYANKFGV